MPRVNTTRFSGFSELYDTVRPQPPQKVVDIVSQILGRKHVDTVAEVGSGTGLSTRIWTQFSSGVVCIEPTPQAYTELIRKARNVEMSIPGLGQTVVQYPKKRHIDNMKQPAVFAYCGSVLFDNTEPCDAERFIGIALSQGQVQDVLKHSPGELQSEIQILRDAAARSTAVEMRFGYTLHFGLKNRRASA